MKNVLMEDAAGFDEKDDVSAVGVPQKLLATKYGRVAQNDPSWVRRILIGIVLVYLTILVVLPLVLVFVEAFAKGAEAYWAAITDPTAMDAIKLTLMISFASVACNVVFGLCAAWAITKFRFRGKSLLVTLIDIPFSVSPVVSGLIFVLLFGARGWLGPWLQDHDLKV